ncbi:hypothetical protein [Lampropedia aestuarii]|nr:hypothetical protein [Lampropedia aestuarii]
MRVVALAALAVIFLVAALVERGAIQADRIVAQIAAEQGAGLND